MPIGLALGIDVLTAPLGIVPQLVKEHFGGAAEVALMGSVAGAAMMQADRSLEFGDAALKRADEVRRPDPESAGGANRLPRSRDFQ
jgi:hypothetical protein